MIYILLIVIGIFLIISNKNSTIERANDEGSFANAMKIKDEEFTEYDMKLMAIRKDMAESILDLQREIQELREKVQEKECSKENLNEDIKIVELNNDINRDCINEDIISEINFNHCVVKENHSNESKIEKIKVMIEEGKSNEEICSSLNIGKGEVLLIRGLYKQ